MLLFLACVPVLVLAYAAAMRARTERAARLASEGLVPLTAVRRVRWRRHVPFALFATAIALMCVALARPIVSLALPERQGTVILAFDVSNSMLAKDFRPTRIAAAKAAAVAFAKQQPSSIRIGVVAFGDGAVTVLKPTNATADVISAIKGLSVGGGTSIGQGLLTSLDAIAGRKLKIKVSALQSDAGSVKIGFFGSSAIVLLSDGENTSGPDPLSLAEVASTAGIRVHAIGIGTAQGTVVQIKGFSVATALDAGLLKQIAKVTDGTYHQAADAEDARAGLQVDPPPAQDGQEAPRGDQPLRGGGRTAARRSAPVLSLAWFGRVI